MPRPHLPLLPASSRRCQGRRPDRPIGALAAAFVLVTSVALGAEVPALPQDFAALDTSGNGYLSGREITPAVQAFDTNRDGRITWEEFSAGRGAAAAAEDDALWRKLDWNPDGWLDGRELDGGWTRFDADRNGEVTRAEFLAGRARERAASGPPPSAPAPSAAPFGSPAAQSKPAPQPPPPRPAPPARAAIATPVAPLPAPAADPVVKSPAPRAGHIVGSITAAPGRRLGKITVEVSGHEDGKLGAYVGGGLAETVQRAVIVSPPDYAIAVPPGAYRARAYSTHEFNGATYHFPLELMEDPTFDYRGLQLQILRGGLVRSFVLKLTGPRKGESEAATGYTETTYKHAFYGGRIDFRADEAGPGNSRPLRLAYPAVSRLVVHLVPVALVDGSPGAPLVIDLALGDDGKWIFNRRGVVPGTYRASAVLRTPDGRSLALKVAAVPGNLPAHLPWQAEAEFTFKPASLGPVPRMGVDPARLYLAQ